MDTAITEILDSEGNLAGYDVDDRRLDAVVAALARNNTFCPNVTRVVYSTKLSETVPVYDPETGEVTVGPDGKMVRTRRMLENPLLVTVVYFADGTKVTVKNSGMDAITLEERKVTLSDGTEKTITTASRESREMGLVYALAKRLVCVPDGDGNVMGGLSGFIQGLLARAYEQDVESAKIDFERDIRRKAPAKKPAEGSKPHGNSLREAVAGLTNTVDRLNGALDKLLHNGKDLPETGGGDEPMQV